MSRLPGRAPQLYRRFAAAGAAAVDLLGRLLEFDPGRRASAGGSLSFCSNLEMEDISVFVGDAGFGWGTVQLRAGCAAWLSRACMTSAEMEALMCGMGSVRA